MGAPHPSRIGFSRTAVGIGAAVVVVGVIALASARTLQGPQGGRGGRGGGPGGGMVLFTSFDIDGDQALSGTEMDGAPAVLRGRD